MQKLKKIKTTEIGKIPDDWKLIHLNEIVEINPETIYKNYPFEDIQYIDIGSVENYQIKKYEYFKLNERPSRAQRIVRKNDIIVSTVRPYLHGFAKIVNSSPSLICSTGFAVLRPKDLRTVDFIFNFIKSHDFESQLNSHMTGLAYPAVTSKIVGNTILGYPKNNNEIEKIGVILSNIDKLIQKTGQMIEQTQRLKKGLMQKLLTKGIGHTKFKKTELGEIPEQWNIVEINEITTKITDIDHKMPKKVERGIPFITVKYLTKYDSYYFNLIHDTDLEYILEEDFKYHSKKFNTEYGDLLISRYGTIGVTKMINTQEKLIASYSIALIKPKRELIFPLFLTHVLNSDKIKRQIQSFIEQSSNTNLDLLRIKKIKVPRPNLEEQQKISSMISYIDLLVQKKRKLKLEIENLKKGLMQQLLTGKIRVKV